MHAVALVILPKDALDPEAHVKQAMAPFEEEFDDEADRYRGHWDWWQIGGRWTGKLSGYDPRLDPDNIKTCSLCNGTGKRPDAEQFGPEWLEWSGGCNGCGGKGAEVTWPTSYKRHHGDVGPVTAAKQHDFYPYSILTPEGRWVSREIDDGSYKSKDEEEWRAEASAVLDAYSDHLCVVVDYHS